MRQHHQPDQKATNADEIHNEIHNDATWQDDDEFDDGSWLEFDPAAAEQEDDQLDWLDEDENSSWEDDWFDAFVAYAPNKHVSITLAYADLGNIVIKDNQRGLYASVQVGF